MPRSVKFHSRTPSLRRPAAMSCRPAHEPGVPSAAWRSARSGAPPGAAAHAPAEVFGGQLAVEVHLARQPSSISRAGPCDRHRLRRRAWRAPAGRGPASRPRFRRAVPRLAHRLDGALDQRPSGHARPAGGLRRPPAPPRPAVSSLQVRGAAAWPAGGRARGLAAASGASAWRHAGPHVAQASEAWAGDSRRSQTEPSCCSAASVSVAAARMRPVWPPRRG
jgi:hypothetical protein